MEKFFQYFETETGYKKPEAQKIIKLTSAYLAKHYPREFAIFIQYFLAFTFEHQGPGTDGNQELHLKNLNV